MEVKMKYDYSDIEQLIPQKFWTLKLTHTLNDSTVEFNWDRHRLFDRASCKAFLMICQSDPIAKVVNVEQKPKNKWRPQAMDTIELKKLGSRTLNLSANETMKIAEKLYSNGIISYPRTETNIFPKEIDLKKLVTNQLNHPDWGGFAQRVMDWQPNPRNGQKSDEAHPPIHPLTCFVDLQGNEKRVYELICRHFLACVSKDATGSETMVNVVVADEQFTATGRLVIYERNYLDVYIYEKWNGKEIHQYQIGNTFQLTEFSRLQAEPAAAAAPEPDINEANMRTPAAEYGRNQSQTVDKTQNAVRSTNPATNNVPTNIRQGGSDTHKCSVCNGPVITLTVERDGPTKGREFYKCAKQPHCDFFAWADASGQNTLCGGAEGKGGSKGKGGAEGKGGSKGKGGDNAGQSHKRKCGNCKQEGHTRVKCPRLQP